MIIKKYEPIENDLRVELSDSVPRSDVRLIKVALTLYKESLENVLHNMRTGADTDMYNNFDSLQFIYFFVRDVCCCLPAC